MCHNRSSTNKINSLHQRCLSVVVNDKKSSFAQLLEKDSSVSRHHLNLKKLPIEIFKIKNELSPLKGTI